MPRYIYKGPVMEFNTLLADIWEGETVAPSEKKARSNLTYQFKKRNNRIAGTRITLLLPVDNVLMPKVIGQPLPVQILTPRDFILQLVAIIVMPVAGGLQQPQKPKLL